VSDNRVEAEKNFTSALISALSIRGDTPTKVEIEKKAAALAMAFDFDGDLGPVVEETMIAIDTRMGAGVSLVDIEAKHDEEWVYKREGIEWTYSDAYEGFLKKERWAPGVVQSLSDVGSRILGHLQDPTSEGAWNRRGLVIGHVQSGKTANYMGVIAKAADAGYKFIIVIAGIHNNLRRQTQERIDEGFIGRSSDPESRVNIGVGLYNSNYPHPATLTNINDDFNKTTASKSGWKLNDFSKPIILVIKKNVRTLDALHKWLKDMNAKGDGRISDVPMLMIDDEADNASINTNKEDLDPTRTNAAIRRILGLFAKSCYVGYTATPFANIFINPDAYNDEVREELFPRDFIYCLDAPTSYFGPDKVFLNEESSARVLERILDCDDYIPEAHKSDATITELPPSLYRAIHQFILARAIRNLRGQDTKHCSMMVNVSRFVGVQKSVRDLISLYEKKLREAVKANYKMDEGTSSKNHYMQGLRQVFDEEYPDCGFAWDQVKGALWSVFDSLRLYVVNSKSDEALDYRKYEKDGHGLTALAVGGLSLSRGLTIEGLSVSYMYRNTRMYDTLMQMGRWFGYRPGYEDLCRVHLSPDSINWYSHIAEKSEELRQQIRRMRRDGLTPRQFGLYVEAHPDRLLITAANKMRSGEKMTVAHNYSGRLIESYILPTDGKINQQNEELIEEFWRDGFGKTVEETEKGWWIEDAEVDQIEEFLTRFRVHSSFAERKSAAITYLHKIAGKYPRADVLLISVRDSNEDAANYKLGTQERTSAKLQEGGGAWRASKDRVASRGDEKLGLTPEQRQRAIDQAAEEGASGPSDFHYRAARDKPLLMIHIIDPTGSGPDSKRVPAFGISYPPGDYSTTVEVVANRVWVDNMHGSTADTPDEEEDYDE
jgi:hypothetical protein